MVAKKSQQNGAISALKAVEKRKAAYHGILFTIANGMAPLSSEIGMKDNTAVISRIVNKLMVITLYTAMNIVSSPAFTKFG